MGAKSFVSPAIIRELTHVLRRDLEWQDDRVKSVVRRVAEIAGSGIVIPRITIHAV